ncbi:MAG: hypothetical protein KDE59_14750, partial [Anaerolineales bacterium]|nr:hypothetical protein [Anaerolineales bacterium]
MLVLDIEERTSPVIVNGLSLGAPIMDLALAGDLMIAVGGTRKLGRMWILAGVASGQPELAGEVPLPGSGTSVTAAGAIAYVTHAEGVSTYDLAQPTAPVLLDDMQTREAALTILLGGDIAYLAAGNLKIVDVAAPTGMEELGQHFDGYRYVSALAMSSDGLYVLESGCEFSGCWAFLTLLDVSDPAVPVTRAITLIPGVGGGELVVQHDLVYVVTWAGLRAFRLTAGELAPAGELTQSGLVSDIILHPELALLYAANEQGIAVLDVAEATPRLLTHFPFDGEFPAGGLAIIRDVLFVSVYNLGLNLLDISQPEAPTWIDEIEQVELVINDGAVDLVPDGSYLYMNSWRKLVLADVVDPANPVAVGQFATEGQGILSVAHRGAQVALGEYHTNGDPGGTLRLLDVADPAEPQELASLGLPCAVRDVAFVEALIYALLGTCSGDEAPARLALVEVGPAGELTLIAILPLAGPDAFAPVTGAGQMTL